jgi:RimJ/RimL family protein N-acetyltransferase
MIDFNITLENKDLLLRPIISSDFENFKVLTLDKSQWYYFTSDLSNEDELKLWVANAINDIKNETRLPFTVIYKPENKIVGSSSLGNYSERDKRIEIGWTWVSKEFHGKTINDQMKFLLMQYCFEKLNLIRVEFKIDVLNIYARNALKRVGATEEGILRSHTLMINNRRRDTIYYSVLNSEWENIKKNYKYV